MLGFFEALVNRESENERITRGEASFQLGQRPPDAKVREPGMLTDPSRTFPRAREGMPVNSRILLEAATSATAATFPRSCVAVVATVAAFPEEEGRQRFQASSKSSDILRRNAYALASVDMILSEPFLLVSW